MLAIPRSTRCSTCMLVSHKMAPHLETDLSGVPEFYITPYGIHARIPCIRDPAWGDYLLAILFASDTSGDAHFCLVLQCTYSTDPKRPLYRTRGSISIFGGRSLVNGGEFDSVPAPQWEDIYIWDDPPRSEPTTSLPMNYDLTSTPFFIPPAVVRTFLQTSKGYNYIQGSLPDDLHSGLWSGSPPATLRLKTVSSPFGAFSPHREAPDVDIYLGMCRVAQVRSEHAPRTTCWAAVRTGAMIDKDFHDCSTDHIDDWPNHTRSWDVSALESTHASLIALAFAPSRINANAYMLTRIKTMRTRFPMSSREQ